jgi:hypothetical protein
VGTNEQPRRRRRVRGPEPIPAPATDPAASAQTTPVFDEPAVVASIPAPAPEPALASAPIGPAADGEPSGTERGLRGLVGPGSSQVSPAAALRARDAARARPEDIARAEAELTIIRRNWSPRE